MYVSSYSGWKAEWMNDWCAHTNYVTVIRVSINESCALFDWNKWTIRINFDLAAVVFAVFFEKIFFLIFSFNFETIRFFLLNHLIIKMMDPMHIIHSFTSTMRRHGTVSGAWAHIFLVQSTHSQKPAQFDLCGTDVDRRRRRRYSRICVRLGREEKNRRTKQPNRWMWFVSDNLINF